MEPSKFILEEEEGIDLRKWLFRILDNWLFFLICAFVALSIAYLYNKFSVSEYQLSASLLIREKDNPLDKGDMLRLTLYNNPYKLENEIGIVNSSEVKKQTLKSLDFFIEYYQKDHFRRIEKYHSNPFEVIFDSLHVQAVDVEFEVSYLSDTSLLISADQEEAYLYNYNTWSFAGSVSSFDFIDTISIGDTVSSNMFNFLIVANPLGFIPGYKDYKYSFYFRSLPSLVNRFGGVQVDISKGSSIMRITMDHSNPQKAAVYLNSLVSNYLLKGIERENKIAERTIDFIDFQLSTLVDSLQSSEQKLEDFRSTHKIVNIDYQAQQTYNRQSDIERQRAELITRKRYLDYLKQNLQTNTLALEEIIVPTTLGIEDVVLNNLILELVEMYRERTEMTVNTKKNNPYISSLDSKIESQKQKLSETVDNLLNATSISMDEIQMQSASVTSQLTKLPKDQQELLRFERKFQLNDELYTYLLTRRSEMQIKKASNIPSNEILEVASIDEAIKVHPNKKLNYIMALLLGLMVPFLIIYINALLNNRVQSHEDIKEVTSLPVIGTLYQNDNPEEPIVMNAPASLAAESFRMLRANMQFIVGEDKNPVLVVTSAMKGEGKSFTAINLAAVQASYGKKVCLVDLDLRRPRLSEYLKIDKRKGMSNYLIGKAELDEVILSVNDNKFDLIPSGPIPPNPSELVASSNLESLLKILRERYDYIILDSPPIGMVSDAMFISKIAGYLLLVVRHNITYKQLLSGLIEELERNQIKGINLIYNEVPVNKKGYYRYGGRHGYYYSDDKKGFWSRLFQS